MSSSIGRRRNGKGKYNEQFHTGLYRFQDMSKEMAVAKAKGTFGLSLQNPGILRAPMIVIPRSDKEAARLRSTGMYKRFRTFEAGRAAYENSLKARLGKKRGRRLGDKLSDLNSSDLDSQESKSEDGSNQSNSNHQ